MTEMTPEKLAALMSVAVFGAEADALTVSVRDDGTEALIPYASLLLELQGALEALHGFIEGPEVQAAFLRDAIRYPCSPEDSAKGAAIVEAARSAVESASRLLGCEK